MYEKYIIVKSIEEAAYYLSQYADTAKIIAGGTDLVLEIERGAHQNINVIVDISRVPNLDRIFIDQNNLVHIGSMVTHNGCLRSEIIQKFARCLIEACEQVGSPQIRNRGTITGNIATASPANDTISALMVLDAVLELVSLKGKRKVGIREIFSGPRKTIIQPDEIIGEIQFKIQGNHKSCFVKDGLRNAQAISIVNISVSMLIDRNTIKNAKIALGAVGPTVFRAIEAENYLIGKKPDESEFEIAGELAAKSSLPISDIRASDGYRKKMVAVHVKRALLKAANQKEGIIEKPVVLWGKSETANSSTNNETYEITKSSLIKLNINGKEYEIEGAFEKTLMDLIRENALLTGTKEGCGEGECGSCTVYMDGVAVLACLVPAPRAHKTSITTIEGIGDMDKIHKVQQTFIEEGAVQCGYCTPGFVMSAVKLLEEKPNPTVAEIETAVSGNLCRCTGYYKIIKAIEKAAGR